jgi:hypothetical protein
MRAQLSTTRRLDAALREIALLQVTPTQQSVMLLVSGGELAVSTQQLVTQRCLHK